jgi:hypothetical protein
MLEEWNIGMVEYWNAGMGDGGGHHSTLPVFH